MGQLYNTNHEMKTREIQEASGKTPEEMDNL